jgi:hypothetical protein
MKVGGKGRERLKEKYKRNTEKQKEFHSFMNIYQYYVTGSGTFWRYEEQG